MVNHDVLLADGTDMKYECIAAMKRCAYRSGDWIVTESMAFCSTPAFGLADSAFSVVVPMRARDSTLPLNKLYTFV